MIECTSCKTPLPDDATFCSSCGRVRAAGQGTTIFDPAAQRAATVAAQSARRAATAATQSTQAFVAELGIEKALCAVGGMFGVLGAFLPYVSLSAPPGTLSTVPELTLLHFGLPGWLVLIVAILLGGAPFLFRPSRAIALAGVSLSTIVLAKLFSDWFTIGMLQVFIQMINEQMSRLPFGGNSPGVAFGGAGGFACLFVGFAVLLYAYIRSAAA